MFERFTPNARAAVVNALDDATDEIGIDQLVYGLLRDGDGIAARVLRDAGYEEPPPPRVHAGARQLPFTSEAKEALEHATHEADVLGHALVGTEHVLMAVKPELRDAVLRALRGDEL